MIWQILGLIVIGAVIGVLARLIKPGKQRLSMLATILLGIAGAVIGGLIASLIGTGDVFELNIIGFIIAVVAAVLLVGVAEGVSGGRNRAVR
ncbi:GlsB/YeaQ/YmgE family stress response membrane protein [Geodermatophilus sp. SYSU D00815]